MKVPEKVGDYHLRPIQKCGAGSYGVVLRAFHETITTRKDVVKLIPIDLLITGYREMADSGNSASKADILSAQEADEAAFQYIIDEANRAARLEHDNVVKIRDARIERDLRLGWIAMEYVSGGTLWKRLKPIIAARKTLPLEEALRYIEQIASGAAWMHIHRLVHGDLKADNVLLAPVFGEPGVFTAKITDFSVLRTFSRRPVPPNGKHTKAFLTKAQAEDVRAIAAMAYLLIAGSDVPPDPNSWFSEPVWCKLRRTRRLQWVINAALRSSTNNAYSAAELRDGIHAYQEVTFPPTYPATVLERLTNPFMRWPLAASTLTGLMIIIGGISYIAYSYFAEAHVQQVLAKGLEKGKQQAQNELADNTKEFLEKTREFDRQTVQRMFETLRLHRHTKAHAAVPPAQLEPVERAYADQVREIEKKLADSPWKDEARPWLDLCKAELALIRRDYKGVVDILNVEPAVPPAPDVFESERVYYFYTLRGAGHFGRGHLDAAAKDFANGVIVMPNDAFAWANLGRLQVEGRKADGIPALTKAKNLLFARPKHVRDEDWNVEVSVLFSLGRAYMFQKQPQPEKAIARLNEAVAYWDKPGRPRDSFFGDCNIDLAAAYGRMNQHNEAQVAADKAVGTYRDLQRIAPLPHAVKANYAIALFTSVSARVSKNEVNAVFPDATEAINILDDLQENTLLAKACLIRSSAYFRQNDHKFRSVRAANIFFGGFDGFATFSPVNWLTDNVGIQAMLPAMLADAVADAKRAAQLFHDTGDLAEEGMARGQLVANLTICGDRHNALAEVRIAIPLVEKANNTQLLAVLRRMEQGLLRELGLKR